MVKDMDEEEDFFDTDMPVGSMKKSSTQVSSKN